jgi:hypothetical protein
VQDRLAEPAAGGELGIDVQRVAVAGEPVEQRLLGPRLPDRLVIGRPVGQRPRRVGAARAAEAALAADEHAAPAGHQRLAGGGVDRHVLGHHQRAGPLVVDAGHGRGGTDGARHRQRPVQLEVLLGVHEHGPVEVPEAPGHRGLRDQHRVGRQHLLLDALTVLGREVELLERVAQAGPDADRVQQRVLAVPGPPVRLARHPDQAVVKPHG